MGHSKESSYQETIYSLTKDFSVHTRLDSGCSLHALHAPRTFLGSHIGFDFDGVWLHVDMAYPVEFAEVFFIFYLTFSYLFFSLVLYLAGKHIGFGCGGVWLHIDMAAPVKSVSARILSLVSNIRSIVFL